MNQDTYSTFRSLWKNVIDEEYIGQRGEQDANRAISRVREFDGHAITLRNVYLPKDDGEYTEIDAMSISTKGIFVFENKNILGDIYGNEHETGWTAVVNGEEHTFYNPIKQNAGHVRWLIPVIEKNIPIISVIMFSDRSNLRKVIVTSRNTLVIKQEWLKKTIKEKWKKLPDVMTKREVNELCRKLVPYTKATARIKEQHIRNIQEKHGKGNTPSSPRDELIATAIRNIRQSQQDKKE